MTKLMIFDLDGTLLYTLEDLAGATNWVLAQYGYPPHPTDRYRYLVGNGIYNLIRRALPEEARTDERVNRLAEEQTAYYNQHLLDHTRPYEGITEALAALRERGVEVAVLTNKPDSAAQQLMKDFFPEIDFFEVFGQRPGVPIKPDPAALNLLVEHAGVDKNEVFYFGDSNVDMEVANNAGIRGVGVLWGYRTKEELEGAGAYTTINKVSDLLLLAEKNG